MSRILTFGFGLLLLTTIIHGKGDDNGENIKLENLLNVAAASNKPIVNNFKPLKGGFIKSGGFGVVFKGVRISDKRPVALKFMKMANEQDAKKEYEMYSYLDAIDKPEIEKLGFCSIYYFGKWNEDYMLMAMSLLTDGDLDDKASEGYLDDSVGNQAINSLILFRNFVRQSKYMHSRGIRHDDIKPGNIMLRGHRSFLIDFNLSSKMLQPLRGTTEKFASRAYHKGRNLTAIDDWESFLYCMCFNHRIELKWFFSEPFLDLDSKQESKQYSKLKDQTGGTIAKIEMSLTSDPLRRVFIEFANEVFKKNRAAGFIATTLPDYDRIHRLITVEIESLIGKSKPALFTWLSDPKAVQDALDEFEKGPFDIAKITDPPFDFRTFDYSPPINYTYFEEQEVKPLRDTPSEMSVGKPSHLIFHKNRWKVI